MSGLIFYGFRNRRLRGAIGRLISLRNTLFLKPGGK